jgi:glutamate formiminotransferase
MPLIAFNVNLQTEDIAVARRIAAAIRESTGGLPFVKALGVSLADRRLVQVTMNLTNYERTSIRMAFDAVAEEARRNGVAVQESEIIGLVPEAAVADINPSSLALQQFSADQILEHRLRATA